jgi:hypothetical protein
MWQEPFSALNSLPKPLDSAAIITLDKSEAIEGTVTEHGFRK